MTQFNFMAQRKLALIASSLLIVASLAMISTRGFNFGIDFTGGTLVELGYEEAPDLDLIREIFDQSDFRDAVVQNYGSPKDVLVRLASAEPVSVDDGEERETVSEKVLKLLPDASMRRIEFVGPQVGEELVEDGGLAMLYALGGILFYVMLRFQWKFAIGSIAALVHDVIIVLGFFSATQMEFDLPVLAAILAVIGYSLNDTIVVFDRIRENFRRMRKGTAIEIINVSLNQTLSRTLITSMTTLLVLLALFFLGGELIHAFATALIIGVLVGTYSSIYVASTTTLGLHVTKQDLVPVHKEGAEGEAQP